MSIWPRNHQSTIKIRGAHCAVVSAYLCACLANVADASTRDALFAADARLQAGVITAHCTKRTKPNGQTQAQIDDAVAERQRQLSAKLDPREAAFQTKQLRQLLEREARGAEASSTQRIACTANGLYIMETQNQSGDDSWHYATIFDGKTYAYLMDPHTASGATLHLIPSDGRSVLGPDAFLAGLAPGGSLVIGRGLSRLQNLRISESGSMLQIHGRVGKYDVSGVLDPKHGCLARNVEVRNPLGTLVRRWTYDQPRLVSGVWVAGQSKMEFVPGHVAGGSVLWYRVDQITFAPPEPGAFRIPLDGPWAAIADDRLGREVVYRRLPVGVANAEDLLPYTRRQVDAYARDDQRAALIASQAHRAFVLRAALAVGAALVILAGAGALLFSRKAKASANA